MLEHFPKEGKTCFQERGGAETIIETDERDKVGGDDRGVFNRM